MCIEETCIPYCATHISEPICKNYGKSPRSNEPKTTGEVCVNAEYDVHVPSSPGLYCGEVSCVDFITPAHDAHAARNFCVDVYNDDLADATNRLNSLLEEKKTSEGWKNDKYYCMYGATESFMSIFQPASLEYSNKYCGRTEETEEDGVSFLETLGRGFEMMSETRAMFRKQCDTGSFWGCFNAASLSAKL